MRTIATLLETAVALRAQHSGMRIVLCSAFLDNELRARAHLPGVIRSVAAN